VPARVKCDAVSHCSKDSERNHSESGPDALAPCMQADLQRLMPVALLLVHHPSASANVAAHSLFGALLQVWPRSYGISASIRSTIRCANGRQQLPRTVGMLPTARCLNVNHVYICAAAAELIRKQPLPASASVYW